MGKFNGKDFMGFSGKAGGLVCYYLKGQRVVRQVGYPTGPRSEAQIAQAEKMKVVNTFLKPLKNFINAGFSLEIQGTTKNQYNEAVAYTALALESAGSNFVLNYAKVVLSVGELHNPEDMQLSFVGQTVRITWTNVNPDGNRDLDRIMMAFYFPELGSAITFLTGPERKECMAMLALPAAYQNEQMIVYAAFQSDDKKMISQSVYLGDHLTPVQLADS